MLTAAHCVHGRDDLFKIRVGDLDLDNDFDGASPFEDFIERKAIHPDYNPTSHTNDVAVLKTTREVPYTREFSYSTNVYFYFFFQLRDCSQERPRNRVKFITKKI